MTIPWPLNYGEFTQPIAPDPQDGAPPNFAAVNEGTIENAEEHRTFTIPSLVTESTNDVARSDQEITPYNYFKVRKDTGEKTGRQPLYTPAEIEVGVIRNEDRNLSDVIPIRLSHGSVEILTTDAAGDDATYPEAADEEDPKPEGAVGAQVDLYVFIPTFRICKGDRFASNARARRFALTNDAVVAQAWKENDTSVPTDVGLSHLAGAVGGPQGVGNDLASQVPFWAFYESTKWAKQHVSVDQWQTILAESGPAYAKLDPNRFVPEGVHMWDMVKVAAFEVEDQEARRPLVTLKFDYETVSQYPDIKRQIDVLANAVVENRALGNGNIRAQEKVLVFAYRLRQDGDKQDAFTTDEPKGYFSLRFDECNTFKNDAGDFRTETYAEPPIGNAAGLNPSIVAGTHAVVANQFWHQGRAIQVEIPHTRGGFTLNEQVSPFRNEALYTQASRLPRPVAVGGEDAAALAAIVAAGIRKDNALAYAETTPDNYESGKPLGLRSVFNFLTQDHALRLLHTLHQDGQHNFVTPFPQPGANGLLDDAGFAQYNDVPRRMELYLPVRRPVTNHFAGATEVQVECVEPFFGYCSGTSQLECQYPLDTRKYGKNFPMTIQDYTYNYTRDGSPLVDQLVGFIKDPWARLEITSSDPPEFTTQSEKLFRLDQRNKSAMKIQEVTSTLDTYKTQYSPGETATVKMESRYGMFEYLFLYVKYLRTANETQSPEHDPIITKIQLKIRGHENLFVKVLEKHDLERISRRNSHALCDWRTLHDHGQGVLIHLSDIGNPLPS